MFTIINETSFTQIINKSEFICYLFPVKTLDEVNNFLTLTRKKHFDATHNCYAYILGVENPYYKASDDGEPSQTAGVVILDALRKNNLTNVLAIVTRYFGGIKLGSGGLIRAYSSSTSKAIEEANIIEIIKKVTLKIETDYLLINAIQKALENYELASKVFTDKIVLSYIIPLQEKDDILSKLVTITKNKLKYEIIDNHSL